MTLIFRIAPRGVKARNGRAALFLLLAPRNMWASRCFPSGSSQKIPLATRNRNASRSNPFDPCHPKYPDEPSVMGACPVYNDLAGPHRMAHI